MEQVQAQCTVEEEEQRTIIICKRCRVEKESSCAAAGTVVHSLHQPSAVAVAVAVAATGLCLSLLVTVSMVAIEEASSQ